MILFWLVHFLSQFAVTNCGEILFLTSRSDRIWKKLGILEKVLQGQRKTGVVKWGETHTSSLGLCYLSPAKLGVKVKWPQRGPPALTLFRPWVAPGLVMWLKIAGRVRARAHTHTDTSITRTGKNQNTFSNGTLVPIREIILLIRITEKWTWLKMKARWSSTKQSLRVCAILLHKIKEQIP